MSEEEYTGVLNLLNSPEIMGRAESNLVEGRRITSWAPYCGTYGMGGPGFLGFELDDAPDADEREWNQKKDWLILTLWGASEWLIISHEEDRPLQAPHDLPEWKPLFSNVATANGVLKWDEFSPLLGVGQNWDGMKYQDGFPVLEKFICDKNSCQLVIKTPEKGDIVISLKEDPALRPPWGSGKPHKLGDNDDLRDCWVLAKIPNIMI